jgi:hypothetical protein
MPISPFSLAPGQTANLTVVTAPSSANNLLVVVQNVADQPVATAAATIRLGSFVATKSAGPAGKGDHGQLLFSNLTAGTYSLSVAQTGYKNASASAQVTSDSKTSVVLESL